MSVTAGVIYVLFLAQNPPLVGRSTKITEVHVSACGGGKSFCVQDALSTVQIPASCHDLDHLSGSANRGRDFIKFDSSEEARSKFGGTEPALPSGASMYVALYGNKASPCEVMAVVRYEGVVKIYRGREGQNLRHIAEQYGIRGLESHSERIIDTSGHKAIAQCKIR